MLERAVPVSVSVSHSTHVALQTHKHLTAGPSSCTFPYVRALPAYVTKLGQLPDMTVTHWTETLSPTFGSAQKTVSFPATLQIWVTILFLITHVARVDVLTSWHRFFN